MAGLLSEFRLKDVTFKNRIAMPPMATNEATEDGEVTDQIIKHYVARAEAQVGLIMVEHTWVTRAGRMNVRQLGLAQGAAVPGFARLAEEIKAQGTVAGIQLTHAGSATTRDACGCQPVGPSAVMHPRGSEEPRELSFAEIKILVEAFARAAGRAREAGFDIIELHGAHGYLLGQFLSPLTNQRADEYGGSLENRARFALEVVREVRNRIGPEPILAYRLGVEDFMPGGLTIDDTIQVARWLVKAGVDLLDISGGLAGSQPPGLEGQGYFLPYAERIRSEVRVPVLCAGGITDPLFADEAVRQGRVDLVGIGRALLENPDWALDAIRTLTDRALEEEVPEPEEES